MILSHLSKTIPALFTLLLAAASAAQQQPGGGMQNPGGTPPQGAPMTTQPGTAAAGTEQNTMQTMADQEFVKSTFENDDAQVRLSQLAEDKSASQDVKQFGQRMVEIHNQLNQQLDPVAKQLDVSQPKGPSKKEKEEIAKLQALSGPAFDIEYIQDMAKEQEQSLKKFRDESQTTGDAALQQAAKQDEPVLSQHFDILKKLAEAHNVPIEEKAEK